MRTADPIPFTVIGGFLGAGKTSLVNRILAVGADTCFAVLVNDFGALNIDESLIVSQNSQIVKLANGCICCSLAGGLVDAMLNLMRYRDGLDHILIEASGVSNPSRIMDFARIDSDLRPGLTLVLVDIVRIEEQLEDQRLTDTLEAQMDSADLFLLTKADIAPAGARERVMTLLAARQPTVPYIELHADDADFTRFLVFDDDHLPYSPTPANHHDQHRHPDQHAFQSIALVHNGVVPRASFEAICNEHSADMLRGKGIVCFEDGVAIWQQTGRLIEFSPADNAVTQTRLIVISPSSLSLIESAFRTIGFSVVQDKNT